MSEDIIQVKDSTFETEVLQSDIPVLVDFWATWCGPCRMFAPIFTATAQDYLGKVKMVKANVDEVPEYARRYGIASIPSLVLFKQGQVVTTKIGMMSGAQLSTFLDANL